MKLKKRIRYQCAATVTPGEYVIDRWDDRQCEETNPYSMVKCEECGEHFCLMHWAKHHHEGTADEWSEV